MSDFLSVYEAFEASCQRWAERPFLAVAIGSGRHEPALRFRDVHEESQRLITLLRAAGYGLGHRVAISLGNQPAHFVVQLALNAIGASAVPINADLTAPELAYVLEHSETALVITDATHRPAIEAASALLGRAPALADLAAATLPAAPGPARAGTPDIASEASLLYTSGTTGRPKGCMLSNAYYLRIGRAYAQAGGLADVRIGQERILNPLPLFHQNAGIFSFMCALLSGNCILMADRFHASTWWRDVAESGATIIHYLGVMPAILMKLAPTELERKHAVRFGIGAGVEPLLHAPFEARFGFPLIELWGMTEVGCGFIDSGPQRQTGTRSVGGPRPDHPEDLEIRLIGFDGEDVTPGTVGELLVRRSGPDAAAGMFAGYLKDQQATEDAWHGGWFHTGDAFWQGQDGVLHFAERKKNIIRRAGENIAAAEVEAVLLDHPGVAKAAVLAAIDELREEEVMACIIKNDATPDAELAQQLFAHCLERLAYYKAPGWLVFMDDIPVTSTQKVQKARIFAAGEDGRQHPRAIDLRDQKKRQRH